MGVLGLRLNRRGADDGHAVEALIRASHDHAGDLVLVTLWSRPGSQSSAGCAAISSAVDQNVQTDNL